MDIKGTVIAITGACGGLGSAVAQTMGQRGAQIALLDLEPAALSALQADLARLGVNCLAASCDVRSEEEVDNAMRAARDHFGRLDVLVNNAGITRDALMIKMVDDELESRMTLQDWQAVIDVNLTGVFLAGRAAAEQMIRSSSEGVIINISSLSRAGNVGQSNYSAAKAGVAALTVTWAKEFARFGIRVNSISPGFIGTEMVRGMKPEVLEKLESKIPLGRIGEPEEIAHTVAYLVENEFVNGRNIEIDGGMRL